MSDESGPPAGSDPILSLARHAMDSMYAAVERQQRWYTLNAAVTVHAVQHLQAGSAADGAFLRTVAAALSTLEDSPTPPAQEVA
jgi:hypothetical protein